MCRLFGQLADPRFDVSLPLCGAENALRTQSHQHPHGWGIAWYEGRVPVVRRGVMAAHADESFVRTARRARSHLVLAHVRDASVGRVAIENTHPFVAGHWVFAHNGTVARFKRSRSVREALERAIAPRLRARLRGETDSERCFLLFLTRLAVHTRSRAPGLEAVRDALADVVAAVRELADRGTAHSTMNFLVSDGRLLAACRHLKPLHVAPNERGGHLFAVASEPIGRVGWEEVPEDYFVGVDSRLRVVRCPLFDGRAPAQPAPR
ncbi:MAG TPA: class II glutamine amidotransferase [Anaeromyxobacteraceae bacterium]|nr:class II glutamine amidotransferase [Anaeromyxobacteraceae bacterium]